MSRRATHLLLSVLLALVAGACGDSGGTDTGEPSAISTGDETGSDETGTDETGDETGTDETGDDETGTDETGETDTGDETGTDETGDETGVDETGDAPTGDPTAAIFIKDPVTESYQTSEVTFAPPTTEDGTLIGEFVEVRNCLNQEGGTPIELLGFEVGALCLETQTATPDEHGDYLHVTPPEAYDDVDDAFAELMMYHHVNVIHDYFAVEHGLTHLDFPLQALVNVQIYLAPEAAAILGAPGGWQPFPNAAFIPEESFEAFMLPPRDNGAIVFGQYLFTDFSYDASVIYHEYTHAMIGTEGLVGVTSDTYGLDNLPGAINEGFADYMAASISEFPEIGNYALTFAGQHLKRDLTVKRVCPDNLTTEIHADGKIIGSAMWAMRGGLGQQVADSIILGAIQNIPSTVGFEQMGNLLVAEASLHGEDVEATVDAVLHEYGVLGCERAKEWKSFSQLTSEDLLPYFVPGKQNVSGGFPDGVPGYVQFYVDVPETAVGVQLTWKVTEGAALGGLIPGTGGGSVTLNMAIREGQPVSMNPFSGGITADHTLQPPDHPSLNDSQAMTLSGACLPEGGGRVYLMMLNTSQGDGQVQQMSITLLNQEAELGVAMGLQTCE